MRAVLAALTFCLLVAAPARAIDSGQWANEPEAVRQWYSSRAVTDAAYPRLGFKSCCDSSEVVHTRFAVSKVNGADEWLYLDHGTWKTVPPDIIHWGEATPDGQPVLFVLSDYWADVYALPHGTPTCFYPGESGN